MKKIISVLLAIFCLCSCSGGQITPKLTELSFTAELSYYNELYVMDAKILKDATLVAEMKEPEALEGLTLTVTSKGITAEYLGLTYTANEATLPFSSTVFAFYLPLLNVINTPEAAVDKDGTLTGEVEGLKYSLTFSPTGLPQMLELKEKRLSVRFYNTEIIKED